MKSLFTAATMIACLSSSAFATDEFPFPERELKNIWVAKMQEDSSRAQALVGAMFNKIQTTLALVRASDNNTTPFPQNTTALAAALCKSKIDVSRGFLAIVLSNSRRSQYLVAAKEELSRVNCNLLVPPVSLADYRALRNSMEAVYSLLTVYLK